MNSEGSELESHLIEALIKGDQSAYRSIYDLHKSIVYNTAMGFLTNKNDAEDITQEVFVQVFRSVKNFKKESKLSTWIYRITITKCLDLLRSRKAKKRFAIFTDIFSDKEKDSEERFIDYEHPGIVEEKSEMSKLLFKEIDSLPANQRIAFVLNKVEKLSYQEISEVMETSVSSVESLIFRAKGNLKKKLEGYYRG